MVSGVNLLVKDCGGSWWWFMSCMLVCMLVLCSELVVGVIHLPFWVCCLLYVQHLERFDHLLAFWQERSWLCDENVKQWNSFSTSVRFSYSDEAKERMLILVRFLLQWTTHCWRTRRLDSPTCSVVRVPPLKSVFMVGNGMNLACADWRFRLHGLAVSNVQRQMFKDQKEKLSAWKLEPKALESFLESMCCSGC